MNYEEAKKLHTEGRRIYRACCDGRVWNAGQMVDVSTTIGYYTMKQDAKTACKEYELFDFDRDHLYTSVEVCDDGEFED